MDNKKSLKVVSGIWSITTILIILGVVLQFLLVKTSKNAMYVKELINGNHTFIILMVSILITCIFLGEYVSPNRFTRKLIKSKPIMISITSISAFVCLGYILFNYSIIANGATTANSIKTINGKVEEVQTGHDYKDGYEMKNVTIAKRVTVVDKDGNKYKLIPNNDEERVSVEKNDNVKLDYLPSENMKANSGDDGEIFGYRSITNNGKGKPIKGILESE